MKTEKPAIVTIIVIIFILCGLYFPVNILYAVIFEPTKLITSALILISVIGSIFFFLLAYGFLKGMKWAWYLSAIVLILGILDGISSIFLVNFLVGLITLIISALIFYYLTRKNVKSYFGIK